LKKKKNNTIHYVTLAFIRAYNIKRRVHDNSIIPAAGRQGFPDECLNHLFYTAEAVTRVCVYMCVQYNICIMYMQYVCWTSSRVFYFSSALANFPVPVRKREFLVTRFAYMVLGFRIFFSFFFFF